MKKGEEERERERERERDEQKGRCPKENGGEVGDILRVERDRDRKSSNQVKKCRARRREKEIESSRERVRGRERKREIERESKQTFAQSTCFAKIWIQLSLSIIIIFCMDFFSFVPLSRV